MSLHVKKKQQKTIELGKKEHTLVNLIHFLFESVTVIVYMLGRNYCI